MYNQIENVELDSFTHSIKVFALGMIVAFMISIFVGSNSELKTGTTSGSLPKTNAVIDCNDQASLLAAQDRSRNGIANGCSWNF